MDQERILSFGDYIKFEEAMVKWLSMDTRNEGWNSAISVADPTLAERVIGWKTKKTLQESCRMHGNIIQIRNRLKNK